VFVCILPEKAIPEMTYTVSRGMLNPTHSLMLNKDNTTIYLFSWSVFYSQKLLNN